LISNNDKTDQMRFKQNNYYKFSQNKFRFKSNDIETQNFLNNQGLGSQFDINSNKSIINSDLK